MAKNKVERLERTEADISEDVGLTGKLRRHRVDCVFRRALAEVVDAEALSCRERRAGPKPAAQIVNRVDC